MRYAFIKMHQKAWPITLMCRVLEVQKQVIMIGASVRAASNALDGISEKCLISIRAVMVHRASP